MNGIVKYEVSRAVDHDGGRSLNSPGSWGNVDDFRVSSSSTCSRPPALPQSLAQLIRIFMCCNDYHNDMYGDIVNTKRTAMKIIILMLSFIQRRLSIILFL